MTSEPGSQTIEIHMLPNISQSKGNQTMFFFVIFFFKNFKNHAENEAVTTKNKLYKILDY